MYIEYDRTASFWIWTYAFFAESRKYCKILLMMPNETANLFRFEFIVFIIGSSNGWLNFIYFTEKLIGF